MNLQGIVDSNLKFIHVTVGYPGSIHDARVLRLSHGDPYELAENEQILSGPTRDINGTEIRPLLAGDSAYPLTNWLVKPCPDRGRLTPDQRKFNVKFSALRSVVERGKSGQSILSAKSHNCLFAAANSRRCLSHLFITSSCQEDGERESL